MCLVSKGTFSILRKGYLILYYQTFDSGLGREGPLPLNHQEVLHLALSHFLDSDRV